MLMSSDSNSDQWMRIFSILETKLHDDGYTIYKISSIVFQRSHPEVSTSVNVWRRYSTVHQLYKDITKLHVYLNLPGKPPIFSKPSLINRFDDEVIETRKKSILKLLQYCGQHPQLFTSVPFTNFFIDATPTKKRFSLFRRLSSSKLNSNKSPSKSSSPPTICERPQTDIGNKQTPPNEQNSEQQESSNGSIPVTCHASHEEILDMLSSQSESSPSTLASKLNADQPKSESSLVKKTSNYFQRAEQLVTKFLTKEVKVGEKKTGLKDGVNKKGPIIYDPYIKNYKVHSICGKVIVATDSTTQNKVVIKVIEHSEGGSPRERCTVPSGVPFMAPLLKVHEGECAIYLVVPYISGGKLWDHLKRYIKQPPSSSLSPLKSNYGGQRLISEDTNAVLSKAANEDQKSLLSTKDDSESVSLSFNLNLAFSECRSTMVDRIQPMVNHNQRMMSSLSSLVPLPSFSHPTSAVIDEGPSIAEMSPLSPKLRSVSLDALNDERGPLPTSLNQKENVSEGSGTLSGFSDNLDCSIENFNDALNEDPGSDKTFDIARIIENSRKLLNNVNQTLEKSKLQVFRRTSGAASDVDSNCAPVERNSSFVSNQLSTDQETLPYPHSKSPLTLASVLDQYKASRCAHLPEALVRVWLSQVVSAIEALHNQGIVWGDFNPSNILLEEGGGIVLTHFSDWALSPIVKRYLLNSKESLKQGYVAPELSSPVMPLTFAADWWSVGALLFHFVTGQDLRSAHPSGIHSHTRVEIPPHVSSEAASLIQKLLCVHPSERLGGGCSGAQEIKDHPFFFGIEWCL